MNRFLSALYVALLSLTLCLSASLHAQGIITGTLSGTVVDPTGAVIPKASITVKDLVKGTTFTTTSQSDGNFVFQSLPIDTYSVTITATGFTTTSIPAVSVTTGSNHDLGKEKLSIGVTTDITVEPITTAQLDTTQSQVSSTFDSEQLQSLPLGNGFDSVALLEPGVAQTHDLNFSNTNGANFSSNGARGRDNNFELDGQSNNDNSVAGPQIFFGNQDAIQEIQVIQSNFSAQYGRDTGTVVNYITKSGSNALHGSAFEIYSGSWLSSYPNQDKSSVFGYCAPGQNPSSGCSSVQRLPESVDNKWGATIGGPILKDRLFFFGSTYFEHTNNGPSPFNSSPSVTPTPAGLQELATLFPGNAGVAALTNYGPYGIPIGNPQPFGPVTSEPVTGPGGNTVQIPVSEVQRIVSSGDYTDQEDLGRVDWQIDQKDRLYVRYFYQKNNSINDADGGAAGTFYNVPDVNYSVGADITHTFSPRWLNQTRYSFQESKLDFQGGSFPNCTVNNFTACPGNLSFTNGTDLGFGEATNLPQGRTVKVTQVQDNVSFTSGRNTLLFGGEFDYQNSPNVFLPLYNGEAQFAALDDLIHQSGNFLLATGNPVIPFTENDYALYFQDDFKATNDLTLNLGLRWEFFGQAINELHNATVKRESNPATAIWNTSLPLSARTTPLVQNAYKNFEPRVGFAWNPSFDKKLVIRGGYSIGFDPQFYNIFLNAATVAPVATSAEFACNNCLGTGNFTGAGLRSQNISSLPLGGNPAFSDQDYVPTNFHNPYLETYSLGIEHQITNRAVLKVAYTGSHGVGNFQSIDGNPLLNPNLNPNYAGLPSVATDFPKYANVSLCTDTTKPGAGRPNCALGNQSIVGNYAFSIYNSLQTQITMKSFHGFSGQASYTFANEQDNSSEIYSTGAGGNTIALPQNPLNNDYPERGTSGFNFPNVFTVSLVYQFPKINLHNGLVSRAVNGWQVNEIYQFNSGQAFNPYQPLLFEYGLDSSYCDTGFNVSTVGPGADSCRLVLNNPKAPLNTVGLYQGGQTFDLGTSQPEALSTPHWLLNNTDIAQHLGNPYPGSGRNILRAQRYNNIDASVFKDTKLTDRVTFELQLTAFNAFNHQYRGTPLTNAFYDDGATGNLNPFLSNAYNTSGNRNVSIAGKIKF